MVEDADAAFIACLSLGSFVSWKYQESVSACLVALSSLL
jgi:hypothetical protein